MTLERMSGPLFTSRAITFPWGLLCRKSSVIARSAVNRGAGAGVGVGVAGGGAGGGGGGGGGGGPPAGARVEVGEGGGPRGRGVHIHTGSKKFTVSRSLARGKTGEN